MVKSNTWCVYRHTSPSGKIYIGITSKEPKRRWNSGHGYRENVAFFNAIRKYGWNNITHEVLHTGLSQQEAIRLEQLLISYYRSTDSRFGYNISPGGEIGRTGFHSWNAGLPKEQQPQYGKPKPKEVREKIAKTLSKPIYCVELDKVFNSAQTASKELGVAFPNISHCLHGRRQKAGGYHWRWADAS